MLKSLSLLTRILSNSYGFRRNIPKTAVLKENCLLYITELHTKDYQKYSYHYQKNDGDLIARWDNKPHWRDMSTYPHHKHENDQVSPSHRVTIVDVLDQIEKKIAATKGLP